MKVPALAFLLASLLIAVTATANTRPAPGQATPGDLPTGHPPLHIGSDQATPNLDAMLDPARIAKQDRTAFAQTIDLTPLRTLMIQHNDQPKILDSWARQSLLTIRNRRSLPGHEPLYTTLDMAFRREAWENQNIIYVQAIPLRQELARFADTPAEQQRIMTQATLSPQFLEQPAVQQRLSDIAMDTRLAAAVQKVMLAYQTFASLDLALLIVPPSPHNPPAWRHPMELQANMPAIAAMLANRGRPMTPVPGYTEAQANAVVSAFMLLKVAWLANEAPEANRQILRLAATMPSINPPAYASPFRRNVELTYNRTFQGTPLWLAYFAAFALFTVAAVGGMHRVRRWAMLFFVLAVAGHTLAMAVRWYIAGRIPIMNQFESVLGAALFGCLLGLALETWRKNALYGMAMAAVGSLAMTACFVFPFVIGNDIGASIGRVAGILSNTIWLYIHVNVIIASYALIAASAILGTFYLALTWYHTIRPTTHHSSLITHHSEGGTLLTSLDAANVVLLQLAFWLLGAGIVFGAIWADVSWGRPWGWDPKETFALVTWIVYLLIIHIRLFAPRDKAPWTAALSIAGFAVMLFNWIGVNFFLAGLHSYA